MKKEIIITGYGFVGKAVANAIGENNILHIIDPKINGNLVSDYKYADGLIICVGTPSTSDGYCDVSQVTAVIDATPIHIPILIKSTVLPDLLTQIENNYPDHSICYSPEFLRASSANADFINQKFIVLGGEDPECFWQDLFAESLPNCKLFFNCSITEASMVKYTSNAFLATKVAFFNQISDLCNCNNADYNVVKQILAHDPRIGNSHMMVPGADGEKGFGGHCFPKDTQAFREYSVELNASLTILDSAIEYNKMVRKNIDIVK
jgi:UDPglucose 6-dehydrogenase